MGLRSRKSTGLFRRLFNWTGASGRFGTRRATPAGERFGAELLEARTLLATFRWDADSSGDWNDQNNWFNETTGMSASGFPNATGDIAKFLNIITSDRTVTIPDAVTITVGTITIDDNNNYTLTAAGTGNLVFNVAAGNASVNVTNTNGDGAATISTPITLSDALDVTQDSAGTLTISGAIAESGGANAVTKLGTGVLAFTGGSGISYTGTTTVGAGTLALVSTTSNNIISGSPTIALQSGATLDVTGLDNGAITDTLTLASGQTLQGGGTVAGKIVAANGSFISPGASPDILGTGDVTLDAGSTFTVEVNSATPGTGHDQLNVTGSVTIDGATLAVSGTITPSPGQQIVLIKNDGTDAVTGTPGSFAGFADGTTVMINGVSFTISYVGGAGANDATLTEPGPVTVSGDDGVPDHFTVRRVGNNLQFLNGATIFDARPISTLNGFSLAINGDAALDSITIDTSLTNIAGLSLTAKTITINQAVATTGAIDLVSDASAGLVDINADVTAGTNLTIQNAAEVDLAMNVDLTATAGNVAASLGVTAIDLSGASGTNRVTAGGSVNLAAVANSGTPAQFEVNSGTDMTLASVNIANLLDINIDTGANDAATFIAGALLAGTITADGQGTNDTFDFNGTVTPATGGIRLSGADRVTFHADVTANGNATGAGLKASNINTLNLGGGAASTFNDNAGDGIELINVGAVHLTNVTANDNADEGIKITQTTITGAVTFTNVTATGNDPGVLVNGAASFSDTDGNFSDNNDHGIRLIDIAGDVTLVRTTADNNDADGDGTGDGLTATDGGDADTVAIGGNLLIQGARFRDSGAAADHQVRGVFVNSVAGSVTFEDSVAPVQSVSATGNESAGVRIQAAASNVTFTGGSYSDNADHGIRLFDVAGTVRLVRTTADNNDADDDGTGDGFNATDGGDADAVAIGGDFIVEGATFRDTDGAGAGVHQERGVFLASIAGDVTFQDSTGPTQSVTITGNEGTGVRIADGGVNATFTNGTYSNNGAGSQFPGFNLVSVSGAVTFTGVTASGNTDNGIEVNFCGDVTMTNVTVENNSTVNEGDGAEIVSSTSLTVTGGSFSGNADSGIDVEFVPVVSLVGVAAINNGRDGFTALGDAVTQPAITVTGGTFNDNARDGIHLATVAGVTMNGVTASSNVDLGFDVANTVQSGMLDLNDLTLQANTSGLGGNISNVTIVNFTPTLTADPTNDSVLLTATQFQDNANQDIAYAGVANLNVNTLAGADTIQVQSTAAGVTTAVNTGGGDDIILISSDGTGTTGHLDDIAGPIMIDAGAGTNNRLSVSDLDSAAGNPNVTITHDAISGLAGATNSIAIQYGASEADALFGELRITGSNHDDSMVAVESATNLINAVAFSLYGKDGGDLLDISGLQPVADDAGTADCSPAAAPPGARSLRLVDGGLAGDTIIGSPGPDVLISGPAGDGLDFIDVLPADPTTCVDNSIDLIFAEPTDRFCSNAIVLAPPSAVTTVIVGTPSNDNLTGSDGPDLMLALGGNDTANGMGGDDTILGGDGADSILGGDGADLIDAGRGADFVDGGRDVDLIFGSQKLFDECSDELHGGPGNDVIDGGEGDDMLFGDQGDDILTDIVGDKVLGMNEADWQFHSGDDVIHGGDGDDTVLGGSGNDVIHGDAGNDVLLDGGLVDFRFTVSPPPPAGADSTGHIALYTPGGGDDVIFGDDGHDVLNGGPGNDRLDGGDGHDLVVDVTSQFLVQFIDDADPRRLVPFFTRVLHGGALDVRDQATPGYLARQEVARPDLGGDDVLIGGLGNDTMAGGTGRDQLFGQDGDDVLFGLGIADDNRIALAQNPAAFDGTDTMNGGPGSDILVDVSDDRHIRNDGRLNVIDQDAADQVFLQFTRKSLKQFAKRAVQQRVFGRSEVQRCIIRDGIPSRVNPAIGLDFCDPFPLNRPAPSRRAILEAVQVFLPPDAAHPEPGLGWFFQTVIGANPLGKLKRRGFASHGVPVESPFLSPGSAPLRP